MDMFGSFFIEGTIRQFEKKITRTILEIRAKNSQLNTKVLDSKASLQKRANIAALDLK